MSRFGQLESVNVEVWPVEEFIILIFIKSSFLLFIFCSLLLSLFYIASILVMFNLYCITFLEIASPSVILKIIIQNPVRTKEWSNYLMGSLRLELFVNFGQQLAFSPVGFLSSVEQHVTNTQEVFQLRRWFKCDSSRLPRLCYLFEDLLYVDHLHRRHDKQQQLTWKSGKRRPLGIIDVDIRISGHDNGKVGFGHS